MEKMNSYTLGSLVTEGFEKPQHFSLIQKRKVFDNNDWMVIGVVRQPLYCHVPAGTGQVTRQENKCTLLIIFSLRTASQAKEYCWILVLDFWAVSPTEH